MANLLNTCAFVEKGYGQVEPNHLSAQRTGQIYAQLPAAVGITALENGQFVKYDYAATNGGEVNFTGAGEWMLVYNEVKVYRDYQGDKDFAMLANNYNALVYSPITGNYKKDNEGNEEIVTGPNWTSAVAAADPYEVDSTADPMRGKIFEGPAMMGGKTMVPRVFKTNIGDIFTTNTIKEGDVEVGATLVVGEGGYLTTAEAVGKSSTFAGSGDMKWQVVKLYTMPDGQKGAKIMRIA